MTVGELIAWLSKVDQSRTVLTDTSGCCVEGIHSIYEFDGDGDIYLCGMPRKMVYRGARVLWAAPTLDADG